MNFVSNAIKYSSPENGNGSVLINCELCSDSELVKLGIEKNKIISMLEDQQDIMFVKIDCIDNGKGIEKENINKLFKPFQIFDFKSDTNMESSGTIFDQYYLKSISGKFSLNNLF